jgi:hypothetical protein
VQTWDSQLSDEKFRSAGQSSTSLALMALLRRHSKMESIHGSSKNNEANGAGRKQDRA